MIDLLIKWPDRDTAVACGKAMGATTEDENGDEVTAVLFNSINLARIGTHSYVSDNSDPENPVVTSVPGWWVLVRVPTGTDLAALLAPLGPLAPEIVWDSSVTDDEGNPVPRPPIAEAPQNVWA